MALLLETLAGSLALVTFVLALILFTAAMVALLGPEAMGVPRWSHRLHLRRQGLPGAEALHQALEVASRGDLPTQRAMLLLEVRQLLLDLLALRFGAPRGKADVPANPQAEAFLRSRPPLHHFLHATRGLTEDPEGPVEGWSRYDQVYFRLRLADLTEMILREFP